MPRPVLEEKMESATDRPRTDGRLRLCLKKGGHIWGKGDERSDGSFLGKRDKNIPHLDQQLYLCKIGNEEGRASPTPNLNEPRELRWRIQP